MPTILFNAFSFLQKKLKANGYEFSNVLMEIPENCTILELIESVELDPDDLEAVFLNGKAGNFDDVLKDNDRVAFIPPGTPGPHRLLLGIRPRDSK